MKKLTLLLVLLPILLLAAGTSTIKTGMQIKGPVSVGTTTAPNSSAILDLVSTSKSLLLPRMTTTQRGNISSPAEGSLLYDTSLQLLYYHDASGWQPVLYTPPLSTKGDLFVYSSSNDRFPAGPDGYHLISDSSSSYGVSWIASSLTALGDVLIATPNSNDILTWNGTKWANAPAQGHNTLSGIQGGTTNQYYHLTAAEHAVATQPASATVNGYVSVSGQTMSGQKTFLDPIVDSYSTPTAGGSALLVNGSPYTSGTTTTNKPLFLIEDNGNTSTGWSANGSYFGINMASGFTGYPFTIKANGSTVFSIGSNGAPTSSGNITGLLYIGTGITSTANNTAMSVLATRTYNAAIDAFPILGAATGVTNSSGQFNGVVIKPVYSQTSTAAGTDLYINRTENSVGSGAQYLINAAVGGVSKFSVDNKGNMSGNTLTLAAPLAIAQGGTGATAKDAAWAALSPLAAAGSIPTYSTTNAVLPVGTNGFVLTSDTSQTVKLSYKDPMAPQAIYDAGTHASAVTIDWSKGVVQTFAPTGNVTYTLSNPTTGGFYVLKILQDATGSRTYTWAGGSFKWVGGVAPVGSGANAVDLISFWYDGTYYYGSYTQGY